MFDITNRASYEHAADWLFEAKRHIQPYTAIYHLVGCKTDMEDLREVSRQEAQRFADFYAMNYIETSARNGENVEMVFTKVAQEIYSKVMSGEFRVQDGWDGIKHGFSGPRPTPMLLLEAEPTKNKCC